jgi:hypothetical protein
MKLFNPSSPSPKIAVRFCCLSSLYCNNSIGLVGSTLCKSADAVADFTIVLDVFC